MENAVNEEFEPDHSNSESMEVEYEKPRINDAEKAVIATFLNEVFKRSIEIIKNMEDNEDSLSPYLSEEESRLVKEFVKDIFKRAAEVMLKHTNDPPLPSEKDFIFKPADQDKVMDQVNQKVAKAVRCSMEKKFQVKRKFESENTSSGESVKVAKQGNTTGVDVDSHQEFITYGGKNPRGYHIIYMNPKKAPQKDDRDHDHYLKQMDTLLKITDNFINENTSQQPFILVYRCFGEPQSKRMRFQWMVKLYGIMRDRYLDNLVKFIVYNPEIKFKAILKMCKPFMRRELSRKLLIVTDANSFSKEHRGLWT